MSFWVSALRYIISAGIVGAAMLFLGIPLPRRMFNADRFPFRAATFEKEGNLYRKVLVHKWKDGMPDASKVISQMTKKRIQKNADAAALERLIQETCVAEIVHWILILFTPVYSIGIPAGYAVLFSVLYALGNLLFIIIQRYNRPRFKKALSLMKMREMRKQEKKG